MTLVEMLIVISIMALVAAGVAVAAIKYWETAKQKSALTSARVVRKAVEGFWLLHGDSSACPSLSALVSDGILDEDSAHEDPWGTAWRIECADSRVTVISAGPDRDYGTADDIRVPPKST